MHIKDILSDKEKGTLPIFKSDWYLNVYKKTEKITAAVFVVTDSIKDEEYKKDIIKDIRSSAKDMLRATVELLVSDTVSSESAEMYALVRHASLLRSMLLIAGSMRVIRQDLVDVLVREVDGVLQNTQILAQESRSQDASSDGVPSYVSDERRRVRAVAPVFKDVPKDKTREARVPASSQAPSRREAVLKVIREQGVVSIKDISDSIKDCSEKTIQRELMDMIKDELITKTGERRWSRYSLKNL